ncbi:MAG: hypothetical protein H0X45_10860 [Planctomycetes bacterium]|nr:hypothetical protein [Planctomycetota bacterium]
MPDVASFILTSLLSVLAFAIGRCDSRHSPRQVQGLAAFILMVLIAKAFLHAHPAWEAQLLPWREYAALQSYWIWPLALCFFGLIAGHLPRRSTGRSVAVALAALVFATSLWSQRWMVVGIDDRSTAVADRDHHCVQSAGDSCVPASCVSLLSYWGVPATEGEMARLCISQGGTSLFNAYRGLRLKADDHGLRARIVETDVDGAVALGVPLLFGDGSHARVLVPERGLLVVHDPALSHAEVWSRERIARHLRGAVVVVESTRGARPATPAVAVAAISLPAPR